MLIHAAAGGVGMAAVQLARHLGAEVYGTASPAKQAALVPWAWMRRIPASSRTLEFGGQFAAATGGRGVDVVLNALAGEFVDASLRLLAPGGRFIEMGKTDIRDPAQIAAALPGGHLPGVRPGRGRRRTGSGRCWRALLDLFSRGHAGGRCRCGPGTCAGQPDAFRFLSQARHTGKVVLTIPAPLRPRPGTVLVTGAPGTLGRLIARHLAATSGAGRLLLASPDADRPRPARPRWPPALGRGRRRGHGDRLRRRRPGRPGRGAGRRSPRAAR